MEPTSGVSIRRAGSRDLEPLLPLISAYRIFYKQQRDEQRERKFTQERLLNGTSVIYLAEMAEKTVGFMQMFKTYSTVHLANAWILEDLFVDPVYRGSGVATALLEQSLKHAKESGACGMFLETAFDNTTAQRVYERAGWTRENRFYKYNAPL